MHVRSIIYHHALIESRWEKWTGEPSRRKSKGIKVLPQPQIPYDGGMIGLPVDYALLLSSATSAALNYILAFGLQPDQPFIVGRLYSKGDQTIPFEPYHSLRSRVSV